MATTPPAPPINARQEELLEQAAALLREGGLAGLTVRRLAERMGFTEAALYRHFPSKHALLGALIDRMSEEILLGPLRRIAADRERPARERLEAAVRHHLTQVLAVDGLPILFMAEAVSTGDPELIGRMRRIMRRLLEVLGGLLGEIEPPPAGATREEIVMVLVGLPLASAFRHRLAPDPEFEERAKRDLPAFLVRRLTAAEAQGNEGAGGSDDGEE